MTKALTKKQPSLPLAKVPELKELGKEKAEQLMQRFLPLAYEADQWDGEYMALVKEFDGGKGISTQLCDKARELRLAMRPVRMAAEDARKEEKQVYLVSGRAVDKLGAMIRDGVKEKENELHAIEQYYERLEQKRLEEMQAARSKELEPYMDPDKLIDLELATMDEEVFTAFKESVIKQYKERVAKEKAEAEELERLRKENEQLRKRRARDQKEEERLQELEEADAVGALTAEDWDEEVLAGLGDQLAGHLRDTLHVLRSTRGKAVLKKAAVHVKKAVDILVEAEL